MTSHWTLQANPSWLKFPSVDEFALSDTRTPPKISWFSWLTKMIYGFWFMIYDFWLTIIFPFTKKWDSHHFPTKNPWRTWKKPQFPGLCPTHLDTSQNGTTLLRHVKSFGWSRRDFWITSDHQPWAMTSWFFLGPPNMGYHHPPIKHLYSMTPYNDQSTMASLVAQIHLRVLKHPWRFSQSSHADLQFRLSTADGC